MALQLKTLVNGPLENNVILLHDEDSREGFIIDPTFDPQNLFEIVTRQKLIIRKILFTHGHFDHFAGLAYLLANLKPTPLVGLHPGDIPLWRQGGGSVQFRIPIDLPPQPDLFLEHGQQLFLGVQSLEVRHTPGHSPGSVIFHIPSIKTAVVGDLIFRHSVGRTDLDGGNFLTLKKSIESQVFTLPKETTLIPGHGPLTTVDEEMRNNPFVGAAARSNE